MDMKNKICDIIFLLGVTVFLLFFGSLVLFESGEDFSERENRPLATAPELSVSSLTSGEYFNGVSRFYTDRFPLRDSFMALYSLSELALGKHEAGGIFVGNGILAAAPEYDNTSNITATLKKIEAYAEKTPNVHLYVPPHTADALADKIPSGFSSSDAVCLLWGSTAEAYRAYLNFAYEKSNYHTDHHWSTDGAYFAYTQICEMLSERAYEKDMFERVTVSENFYGTAFAACGLPYSLVQPDSILLYRYKGDSAFRVTNRENGAVSYGFYDMSALVHADKYRVFLGGNYAHLSIVQEGAERKRLLLIKDSFANSLIPFLALHFDLEVIDPRYTSPSEIRAVTEQKFEHIVFLLSLDTMKSLG